MGPASKHRVLIVGGGFGGIKTALELAGNRNVTVTLISDKPHFEYHAALYRVVAGRSPMEVCIPLTKVFAGKGVKIAEDKVVSIDKDNRLVKGDSGVSYSYDSLVLALGSETAYFDIPGLEKLSFGFKSITEALELKNHLHSIMTNYSTVSGQDNKAYRDHIIVVGGGASGVEIAGELSVYAQKLAREHQLPHAPIIDLVEAAHRLLPNLPESASHRAKERLRSLGVNVYLNRVLLREEIESVYLKDLEIKAKTVIWTAGVKPNRLYANVDGLKLDKNGRVIVDQFLRAEGTENIYVIGDAASTKFSGMAQTAIRDGQLVADNIINKELHRQLETYQPRRPFYSIPIGPGWALTIIYGFQITGQIGWALRRWADLKFFLTVLSPYKAWLVFSQGRTICETCQICAPDETPSS